MRGYLTSALASFIIGVVPASFAASIEKIVVFGDSLSDNGNLYAFTSNLHAITSLVPVLPKDPPYFKGRFSNGPVWIEDVAETLNLPLLDYAYGGAWAENIGDSGQIVPFGLGSQVDFFLTAHIADKHVSNYLYVIWSGGNDYLHGKGEIDYATTNTVDTIRSQLEWLTYYGAKNFLIVNVPDLSTTPEITEQGIEATARARKLSVEHNRKLAAMIAEEKIKYPDVKLVSVDITQFYGEIQAHPDQYHVKNFTSPCYGGGYSAKTMALMGNNAELAAAEKKHFMITNNPSLKTAYFTAKIAESGALSCANPNEYLYWDHVHPTSAMHQAFANFVLSALKENGVG